MIRSRGLTELSAVAAKDLRSLMALVNETLLPNVMTLITAWNRELVPSLLRMDKTLARVTGHPVAVHTVDGELDEDTRLALVDATAGDVTVTLPAVSRSWRPVTVKKYDATANVVYVDPPAGVGIDGVSGKSLAVQYDTITVLSDGANYWVL